MQVNYLSASTSGTTMSQYATVARLPGVAVAAPLEIVGYLLETAYIPVVLSPAAAGRRRGRAHLPEPARTRRRTGRARRLGWGRRQLARLLTSEAVVTAGTGSVAGAAIGLTVAGVAFGLTLPVLATAALAAVGGTAVTLVAVITVLLFTSGRPLAAVLAADE